jgi:hypothetical protein
MIFKSGDKYIHFTKRGSVNRGVVQRIDEVHVTDTDNCCVYYRYYMVNEKNISYSLDGDDGRFYKIDKEYTKEESEKLANAFKHLADLKSRRRAEIINQGPKLKNIDKTLKDANFDEVIKNKFDKGE